jgi:hypothetical protein
VIDRVMTNTGLVVKACHIVRLSQELGLATNFPEHVGLGRVRQG